MHGINLVWRGEALKIMGDLKGACAFAPRMAIAKAMAIRAII